MHKRRDVPGCDDCSVWEENPAEFVESGEACAGCPWDAEIKEQVIYKLMDYLALQNAGCPIDRNELIDEEWVLLGIIKNEFERLAQEGKIKEDG